MRVVLSTPARAELAAAATAYDRVSTPLRRRFLRAIAAELRRIRKTPDLFARYEGADTPSAYRRALVSGFPYVLVYEEQEAIVRVIAVAHASREPGYWERGE